jgi:GGDEF domain-containing protein
VNQADENIVHEIAYRIRERFLKSKYKGLDLSMGIEYYREMRSVKRSIRNLIIKADEKVYKAKKSKEKIIE